VIEVSADPQRRQGLD